MEVVKSVHCMHRCVNHGSGMQGFLPFYHNFLELSDLSGKHNGGMGKRFDFFTVSSVRPQPLRPAEGRGYFFMPCPAAAEPV